MAENNLAAYYFHQGTNFHAYEYLGVNSVKNENGYKYTFRTWAPSALEVGLVSDFSGWDTTIPFSRITDGGIWELVYESTTSLHGSAYKFRISSKFGTVNKADPYARYSRGGADGASVIFDQSSHKWTDNAYMNFRAKSIAENRKSYLATPINIYEIHLASFLRDENNGYLNYRELADELLPYVKSMGYTHVELLPIHEYPYDASWGYQACGFYAPTSRFGTPDDFKYFVNRMHLGGIGVILDWVPAHFPKDEWGLFEFDGGPLYEYQGWDRIESRSWGTRFFDLGREEVQSFLISNAMYFFKEFHVDGLRVDAVASMIYLDYDRLPGEWIPNTNGTNENIEATAFIRKLNSAIFSEFPDVIMIAEESTAFGGITKPVSDGGLGFSLKWNMGWANDFYSYVSMDPLYRKFEHKALNFPIMYAFSENYCLPISHDEVVHGKKSFIDKMYGTYEDKFLQARASMLLMMTYPGKKLTFMGTEFAQFREWDYASMLEWFMLDYPKHRQFRDYVASLNAFYLRTPPLWELDFSNDGFEWILADEADKNIVAYRRIDTSGNSIIVLISFSGVTQSVRLPVKKSKRIDVVFDSIGGVGFNYVNTAEADGSYFADVVVPPFTGIIFKEINKNIKIKIKGEQYVL